MAYKVKLRVGGMLDMDVIAQNAVESEDKDTKLVTLCRGGFVPLPKETADGPSEVVMHVHDPVKINQVIRCNTCNHEQTGYAGLEKGRDNGDGTFTIVDADALATALEADEELKTVITLTSYPRKLVEAQTLPSGRCYYMAPGKDAPKKYAGYVQLFEADPDVVYMGRYSVVSAPANYVVRTIAGVIVFQEVVAPDKIKNRPGVDFPVADAQSMAALKMLAALTYSEDFDAALFADQRKELIATALASSEAVASGAEVVADAPAAPAADNPFLAALRKAGLEDKVPLQPVPSDPPANVDTSLVAPKKRAPKKATVKTAAERKSA